MADVKWIKITTDIFDDEKILLIESLPDSDSIIVIWFKLLCLAGKMNNSGVFTLNDSIVYTDEMLSTIFRRKETTVKMALDVFEQFGMIERIDGVLTIPNWGKHQTLDQLEKKREYQREYMRKYREGQRKIADKSNCKTNSNTNVSSLDKDIDKDNIICSPQDGERVQFDQNDDAQDTDPEKKQSQIDERKENFEKIYAIYPKKRGKQRAFGLYCQWLKGRVIQGERIKLTNKEMYVAVRNYVRQQEQEQPDQKYWKNFDTLMGATLLDYVDKGEINE